MRTHSMERKLGPHTKAQYKFHSKPIVTFKGVGREVSLFLFFIFLFTLRNKVRYIMHNTPSL